jgi:hypothetical protein
MVLPLTNECARERAARLDLLFRLRRVSASIFPAPCLAPAPRRCTGSSIVKRSSVVVNFVLPGRTRRCFLPARLAAPPHRLSPSATSTPRRLHKTHRLRARPPPINQSPACRAAACQMSRCSTLPGAGIDPNPNPNPIPNPTHPQP